jgi:hypothetical protein
MDSATQRAGEPRKAMMGVVKVSWQDRDETVHTAPAKIEDTLPSGAYFRLKVPIEPGTRVHVSWCRDGFSGTAKWCRADEGEYVVGMRRDRVVRPAPMRMAPGLNAAIPLPVETSSIVLAETPLTRHVEAPRSWRIDTPRVRSAEVQSAGPVNEGSAREASAPSQREADSAGNPAFEFGIVKNNQSQRPSIRGGALSSVPKSAPVSLMRIPFPPAGIYESAIGCKIARDYMPRPVTNRDPADPGVQYQNRTTSFFEERVDMPNRWLNLGNRRQQKDSANGRNGSAGIGGAEALATVRGDLSPLEDIYRTARIVAPRMGYSITKVVEMLRSDHLRGLGDEVKRASVLMALSAAGIPLSDVLQDAAQRQAAVAAYEVEQRKKFEEYWSRRAEENTQLQAEMERVTRQFIERMNRNLAEVQQEKDAFQMWQHTMQYEVLQISAAVTLCAQPTVFETPTERTGGVGGGQNLVAKSA